MRARLAVALVLAGFAAAGASAAGGAAPPPPRIQLAASPARLVLSGSAMSAVTLTNGSGRPIALSAAVLDFEIREDGTVEVAPSRRPAGSARSWLTVSPGATSIPAGGSVEFRVRATVPRGATPGDHHALVSFTTRPSGTDAVGVSTRLGVTTVVRVPGVLRRSIAITGLQALRRTLVVGVRNAGTVLERLGRGRVTVVLRRGATTRRLSAPAATLLPGRRAALALQLPKLPSGRYAASVRVASARGRAGLPAAPSAARTFAVSVAAR
jgi:hypothetical protein